MQQPWPACRSAKGGLYIWSQSTPNSIILERVSCVSSTERLFTCAEPRCYFASPSVFIMMALFCLLVGGGSPTRYRSIQCHFAPMSFLCSSSQYLFTARPRPNFLFLAFSLYHEELQQHYLIAWLRIELLYRSYIQQAECRLPACVFVYIYCEECYLNRTCQSQWNNLQPWATIVFFFLPNISQFLFEKNEKCQQRHRLCPFARFGICFFLSPALQKQPRIVTR